MTVEYIEKAIAKLILAELFRFRAWFAKYDADQFDKKMERDAYGAGAAREKQ